MEVQGCVVLTAFTIGTFWFKTIAAAKLEVRRILHAATIDQPLDGDNLRLIAALYDRHPRREGSLAGFCVGTNRYHGAITRGFQAIMADGSHIPWSYGPCFNPAVDEPSLMKVLRASIMFSQNEALKKYYAGAIFYPCRHCKKPLQRQDAHIHHLFPKFRDIADAFIGLIGLPHVRTSDNLGDEFSEPELRRRWVQFHEAVAQRAVLCASCNAADERAAK